MKQVLFFIPVAGRATRMYPISLEIPKHQLPINGKPLEEYITRKAFSLPDTEYEVLVYKNENDLPLGTAYSLCKIPNIDKYDVVIVWYGDTYSEINLESVVKQHEQQHSDLTFLSRPITETEYRKGIITTKGTRITRFEKREKQEPNNRLFRDLGILIMSQDMIKYILKQQPPINGEFDLSKDIFPKAVEQFNCYIFNSDCFTCDIGTMDEYLKVVCHIRG